MSIIKLGQIQLSTTAQNPDFYMALSLDTGSGFLVPYMVTKAEELDRYYGEFTQKRLCQLIIGEGIPLLVLPVLSKISWANKSSLRINEGSLSYTHPRLETPVDKLSEEVLTQNSNLISSTIYKDDKSFMIIYDFREVDLSVKDTQEQYFIFPYPYPLEVSKEDWRCLVSLKSEFPIYSDYFDKNYLLDNITSLEELTQKVIGVQSSFQGINPIEGSEYLMKLFQSYPESLPTNESSGDIALDYQNYSEQVSAYITVLSCSLCYLADWSKILDEVEDLLTLKPYVEGDTSLLFKDGTEVKQRTTSALERLQLIADEYRNVILMRYEKPVPYYLTNHLEGLKVDTSSAYTERVLSFLTEDSRLVDFYSRIKGPKANKTWVSIERYTLLENSYVIRIWTEEYEELYYINTDLSVDLTTLGQGFSRIQKIDEESKLVSLKIYDYKLSTGEKIDKRDFDNREPFIPYTDYTTHGELRVYNLFPNEQYNSILLQLGGAVDESPTFKSRLNNLKEFDSYEYFPDFFLEDLFIKEDLWKGLKVDDFQTYLDTLFNYTVNHYSQALVDFSSTFLNEGYKLDTTYKQSRFLRFYGTLKQENETVCCFFPYIINFVNNDFLDIIETEILYQLTDEKDEYFRELTEELRTSLIKQRINFIDYDNIRYFYTNIREPLLDPSFIIRFCISKLSREVKENDAQLIACPINKLNNRIQAIVDKVKRLIPLISVLNYKFTKDNHLLNLEFSMTLPKIVNQTFVLNITLNY